MKRFIIDGLVKYVSENKELKNEDIEVIRYGISNLYLQISKMIVITLIAVLLNILIPYLIFTILYNIIRMPSFGIHAKKSYQCWISSIIIFIGIPYLITILEINIITRLVISILAAIYITIYSPADTEKRPIISKKRRLIYKYLSCIISIIYINLSIYIDNEIVRNALLFSLLLQCIIISPITYKVFGVPYNNYKNYIEGGELTC